MDADKSYVTSQHNRGAVKPKPHVQYDKPIGPVKPNGGPGAMGFTPAGIWRNQFKKITK